MDTLVFPTPVLRRLLRQVIEQPAARHLLTAGLRASRDRREWLAREIVAGRPATMLRVFEVRQANVWRDLPLAPAEATPARPSGLLLLGTGRDRGRMAAFAVDDDRYVPIDRMTLVGPGMHTIDLRASSPATRGALAAPAVASDAADDRERWSRTIGALGGEHVWRRLIDLRMTVVGAGRSGSIVARSLAALGVRRLTLVDPDLVERHNLGESEAMHERDVGLPKALVVSRHCRRVAAGNNRAIYGIAGSLWDSQGIAAAKHADVIVSCVDRDGPRLAAALIAAAHHRVLIDVGTGVLRGDPDAARDGERPPRMGADVRLILPGDGCLLCRGGLTDYDGAVRELTGSPRVPARAWAGDAMRERLGSVRSLNLIAAGAALRLLESVVTGRGHGGWMHLEDDGAGRFDISYPAWSEEPARDGATTCAVCLRSGLGDAAI